MTGDRREFGPGEWTAERHEVVARELEFVAACYEAKAQPFRARAEAHRRAARARLSLVPYDGMEPVA